LLSAERYQEIRGQIQEIIRGSGEPLEPSELIVRLRERGVSRELGSTILWEMIGAGYVTRSETWELNLTQRAEQESEFVA
jgi:hypothetical protein